MEEGGRQRSGNLYSKSYLGYANQNNKFPISNDTKLQIRKCYYVFALEMIKRHMMKSNLSANLQINKFSITR